MQILPAAADPTATPTDLLVLACFAGEAAEQAAFVAVDRALGGALAAAAKAQDFTGKRKQQLVLPTLGKLPAAQVALLGLGPRRGHGSEAWLRLGGSAVRLGNGLGAAHVLVVPAADAGAGAVGLVARGARLGAYRFDAYRGEVGRPHSVKKVALVGAASAGRGRAAAAADPVAAAAVVAEAVALARDLVNTPPLDLYPESFAQRASQVARDSGMACQVLGPAQLEKRGMRLLLAVGQGSPQAPRLVHVTVRPPGRPAAKGRKGALPRVALVGKGITFDSGGLCLKPCDSMYGMKMDMGGAAAVLATCQAVARLGLPIEVHGVLALAENMPSGTALRPGDVITSAAGKTVEVNNTDAEGRLVLADALHYVGALTPDCIVDVATLTGACMVALGMHTVGLFSNDGALADDLLAAAARAGEDFWRLPLTAALRDQLHSDIADLRNTGERWGGAITAALFLKEFVGERPWAHLDIAGPAVTTDASGHLGKGGTGVGVAALVDFLRARAGGPSVDG